MTQRHRGFTLIEVAVVIVIIGVIIATVGIRLGDDSAAVEQESQRLALLVQTAQQEAIMSGDILLLEVADNGYRFSRLSAEGKFESMKTDDVLRPRVMPPGVNIDELTLEGAPEQQSGVLLLPTGEITGFSVTLTSANKNTKANVLFRVEATTNGDVKLTRSG